MNTILNYRKELTIKTVEYKTSSSISMRRIPNQDDMVLPLERLFQANPMIYEKQDRAYDRLDIYSGGDGL